MATLNTFHIVSSRTELECLGSLREVGDTKSIQADGRDDSTLERSVLPHAFDRHINRLLQGSATESERKDGKDILRFLRDVARPIRITELLHMLALRKYQEFDERFLLDPQELLEITQGLVVIGSNDLVSFVHPWLKRHLQRDQRWKDEFSDSSFFLTRSCINYLSWARFASGPCTSKDALEARMNISPFLDYASRYWSTHYGTASGNNFTTSQRSLLTSKVLEFLRRDGHVSSARQILLLPDPVWKNPNRQYVQGLALERSGERLSVHANRALRTKLPGHVDLYEVGLTTGLHLATLLDMGGLVKLMLQQSTSSTIHKLDDLQESLLHLAVAYSNDDLVSYLIDKGADLNQQDHQGLSPWHIAAAYGNTSAVKRMLRQQVGLLNVDAPIIPKRARWQRTSTNNPRPLIITASLWTERASCGSTAMHLAARNGHYEVVAEIIKDGRFHWKIEDEDGMTAFHKACKYGWLEIVKLFVDRGTCPKYRSSKDGRSGLHLACKYPSGFEVAKYLLESFPKLCNEKDSNGETALHHAAAGLDSRAVQLLLDHPSVVIDSANRQGRTPMMLAAFNPNRGFELFLRHKRFDGHKEISIPSVAQLTKKRRSIFDAHPVSEDRSIFSDSSLRSRIAKLQCLAESMSEEGPRPATPLVLENITQTWALGQSSLRS
jgi:ankyrin repeat protein